MHTIPFRTSHFFPIWHVVCYMRCVDDGKTSFFLLPSHDRWWDLWSRSTIGSGVAVCLVLNNSVPLARLPIPSSEVTSKPNRRKLTPCREVNKRTTKRDHTLASTRDRTRTCGNWQLTEGGTLNAPISFQIDLLWRRRTKLSGRTKPVRWTIQIARRSWHVI